MSNHLKKYFSLSMLLMSFLPIAQAEITDSLYSKQWALKNIGQTIYLQDSDLTRKKVVGVSGIDLNYVDTSKLDSSKKEIIVAVLDSGLDIAHPDLIGRVWFNEKLCTNAPNAKNLPCNGYNFLDNNTSLLDDVGHGTHVAGIIAANKNQIGIVGAGDPRIKIMPLKVLNSTVNGFVYNGKLITDVIADAMIFAIKNGAEVINLSLGWPKIIDTPKVRAAFQLAEEQNVIVIAAAGNNNKDLPTFPCSYESVICVAAHDNQGHLTDFTNHGSKVDLVAPGEYIVSTLPTTLESRVLRIKNYEVKRGSSQAAPFVTAAIANLKLLHPGLKNDEVRNYLFRSARELTRDNDKRFVKYGRLDMAQLLNLANLEIESFIVPLIKNITEVKFKLTDKRFNFSIPLKNISNKNYTGIACLKNASQTVVLDNECFSVNELTPNGIINLNISGVVNKIEDDSQIAFVLTIDNKTYALPIFFTRDLNNDAALISLPITGGTFEDMAVISNGRRISRMQRVLDRSQLISHPEYFFIERSKQTEANVNISILTSDSTNKWLVKNLILPKLNKILSIHRQDINQDGKVDYMVYALSSDKLNLKLFFYDENLNPLFGKNSEWTWPLTTFEGLPLDGGLEKFDWIQIEHINLGKILVPAFIRNYDIPEADNSKIILDRVIGSAPHLFYLNPKINNSGAEVELRVFDSVMKLKQLKQDLKIDDTFRISLIKTLPLNKADYLKGKMGVLIKVSNDEVTKFFVTKLNGLNYQLYGIDSILPLDGSAIYPVFDVVNNQNTGANIFTNLLNRSRANFVLRDNDSSVAYPNDLINSWENPILALIGSFAVNNDHLFLMENRYTVSFFNQSGSFKYELPVYRDSSFPGQNFSETLYPVLSDSRPGVFVNSTLIFGERLYSMIGTDLGLIRPLSLSVSIPEGCVPLAPEMFKSEGSSNFVFLCTDSLKQLSLKLLPMSQK